MDDRLHDLVRTQADVEGDPDVVLELGLGAAQRGQRRDRGQLALAVVETLPGVDVAVPEFDHVPREIGRDVFKALDDAFSLLAGQFSQAFPSSLVPIVTHSGSLLSGVGPTIARVIEREEAMDPMQEAEELLQMEEADAWFEYLEATRNQSAMRYRELEPWAWARLNQRLKAIRARRARLRPAA